MELSGKIFLDEYYKLPNGGWSKEHNRFFSGLQGLYLAERDEAYKEFIIKEIRCFLDKEGNVLSDRESEYGLEIMALGRVLLFLYQETKEEFYLRGIFQLAEQLKKQPRTISGVFSCSKDEKRQVDLKLVELVIPFYMGYETEHGKKEQYNDIIGQLKNIRNYLFNEKENLYGLHYEENTGIFNESADSLSEETGAFLLALIDIFEVTSEETFEHFKTVESLFKEALKSVLSRQCEVSKLFNENFSGAAGKPDLCCSFMVAASIYKGCRLDSLLEEKYLHRGDEIFSAACSELSNNGNGSFLERCAYFQAYSEKIRLTKSKG